VKKRKVSRAEAASWVARIVSGEVRDKGCPKAYCFKRSTIEASTAFCRVVLISI
jgi:hypothetical protein